MDRAAKQAERQRVARQQALHRQAHLDASAAAAAEYEAIVEALTGAHRVPLSRIDWLTTATASELTVPERGSVSEDAASERLASYTPGWFARTFGGEQKTRNRLADNVVLARAEDDAAHAAVMAVVEARNAEIAAARLVVDRDPDAMVAGLDAHSSLGDLPFSVEGVDIRLLDGRVIAIVDGLDLEDMPEETVTLLKSGKASIKDLAVGKRLEMHRDAICSAAIRVTMEFLAVLPIDEVEVLMLTDILDRGTGHIQSLPVLHLRAAAQALAALHLPRTQAVAVVERLGAHMDWSKRDGFRAINPAAFGIDL
ncbi:hypothetical protein [Sphingomonas kyeonggiensis]|uniref:Uncharacterized protein n=1 Tax=Sphingomonas kyeonggiensis TaxID=1268553 RepID=A0A7W6NWA4_9SPHN|nr:hypothetical protein [Sphingomonas kyeonggiensis]MBB4098003.1 hypothetical protein [Sphingomonas kyeonggiensis]